MKTRRRASRARLSSSTSPHKRCLCVCMSVCCTCLFPRDLVRHLYALAALAVHARCRGPRRLPKAVAAVLAEVLFGVKRVHVSLVVIALLCRTAWWMFREWRLQAEKLARQTHTEPVGDYFVAGRIVSHYRFVVVWAR